VIKQISNQHQGLHGQKISGRHLITTVDTLGSITTFYRTKCPPARGGNPCWEHLMAIENQIAKGEVDSIGGVYYLPSHWVSVVFDFQQGCILYGDSLGHPIPKQEHNAFSKWIRTLYQRSGRSMDSPSPVTSLSTGYQNDGASCGLFALNAIGHHYLDQPLLSPDHKLLACRRMEITLDLIYENTVCSILHSILHFDLVCTADCQS